MQTNFAEVMPEALFKIGSQLSRQGLASSPGLGYLVLSGLRYFRRAPGRRLQLCLCFFLLTFLAHPLNAFAVFEVALRRTLSTLFLNLRRLVESCSCLSASYNGRSHAVAASHAKISKGRIVGLDSTASRACGRRPALKVGWRIRVPERVAGWGAI